MMSYNRILHPRLLNLVPTQLHFHPCHRRFGDKFRWDQKLLLPYASTAAFVAISLDTAGRASESNGSTVNVSDTAHHHDHVSSTTPVLPLKRTSTRGMIIFIFPLTATILLPHVHAVGLGRRIQVGLHRAATLPRSSLLVERKTRRRGSWRFGLRVW